VRNHLLSQRGYDAGRDLAQRQQTLLSGARGSR
jgi:hypothetical protein